MLTRHVQRVALILGAIVAAVLFFLGGAALRLLMGPISLGPFAGVIEDALNRSVAGVVIRFDQAVLEWSRADGKVNLIVLGTKVFDLNGHIIAQAPKADLDFDAASLVQGHLNLKRFGLIGVQLTGVRSKEGAIRLGFGPEQDAPDLIQKIRDILNDSAAGGGSLDSFSIRNARIAFHDEPTGLFIVSPDATFTLVNKQKEMDASLESAVEISGAPARLSATAVLRPDGMPDHGTLSVKGLSLPALTRGSTAFEALKPYQIVSDVTGDYALGKDGEILSVSFHVNGAGSVEAAIFDKPLALDNFAADGTFDGSSDRVTLTTFNFASKPITANGKVRLDFVVKDEVLESVAADLDAGKVQLNIPDWLPQTLNLSRLSVQASYDRKDRKLTWRRAEATSGPLSLNFTGTTLLADKNSPALQLTGSVDALDFAEALKYWPSDVASGAREWVVANVSEGRVGPIRVETDLPAGALNASFLADNAITVTFPFESLTARYISTMTPITGAHGEVKLTGDSFHAAIAAGMVGPIALTAGDVLIPDLHTRGVMTKIKAHAEGKMSDVMQLIDQEPLGYPKRFGINPAIVEGRAAADLDFELPLLRDLAIEQVRIGVQAKTTDLGLPLDKRKLEHGNVAFEIDSKSLTSQGNAVYSGVPINFKWTEDFAASGNTTRVDVTGKLDQTTRPNFGLSEPSWITGTFPVNLSFVGRRFHFDDASVEVDLTNAAAEITMFNLAKRAGVASNATLKLHFGETGAISVSDLAINGQGLSVSGGALSFDANGKLVNASAANLKSGLNDFALQFQPLATAGYSARMDGRSLDASHFFGDDKKKPANGQKAADTDSELQNPFSVYAKVNRLVLHDDVGLRDVTTSISFAGNEKMTGFSLDAMGTGKGRITGKMNVVNGVRNLDLDTDDAGAFINTFVGFTSVRGGNLSARINFPADAPGAAAAAKAPLPDYQGTITLSNVVITDQPFVARLFSAGSLDGPLRLLQGQGIPLTTFSMPFSARGKMVTIREGRAAGPAIGATFSGTLDRNAERIDVTGSLVPLYGLNSILGNVPILGDLLVSKKGEGVFGLTYAMKGNLDEPTLNVNPLSVLTPGIFRRIFEFDPPKEPPPEAQPQASAAPPPQASAAPAPASAPAPQ